jgi:hypothetical protein
MPQKSLKGHNLLPVLPSAHPQMSIARHGLHFVENRKTRQTGRKRKITQHPYTVGNRKPSKRQASVAIQV